MSAPERIWANEGLEWHSFDCSDVKSGWTHPYILATPAALAASPEVAKLVAEAEARGMERAAGIAEHYRDMCGECHWPEEAVIVGGNVANDIAAAIRREAMK